MTLRDCAAVERHVIDAGSGRGAALFEGAGVPALVHSAGVVVDAGPVRQIHLSGVTAIDLQDPRRPDEIVGKGDIGRQTEQILENIAFRLRPFGATIDDIVRVRVYVRAPMTREMFHRIHEARARYFVPEHYPASTLVVVVGLVRDEALIEIDADVVLERPDDPGEAATAEEG